VIVSKAHALGIGEPRTVDYIQAPVAGATKPKRDHTATTQNRSWLDTKAALDASP
jgi:hypothetical protein